MVKLILERKVQRSVALVVCNIWARSLQDQMLYNLMLPLPGRHDQQCVALFVQRVVEPAGNAVDHLLDEVVVVASEYQLISYRQRLCCPINKLSPILFEASLRVHSSKLPFSGDYSVDCLLIADWLLCAQLSMPHQLQSRWYEVRAFD